MSIGAAPDKVLAYSQAGDPKFESFSRSLRNHMRAASRAASAPPLPDPQLTGELGSGALAALWSITSYIGNNWDVRDFVDLDAQLFSAILQAKAGAVPSYYTAYHQAVALYERLAGQLGSDEAAIAFLFEPSPADPPPDWEVVRFWVIQEFIALYMSIGGAFRAYGWRIQPGFEGGPYTPVAPYRTSSIAS